MLDSVGNNVPKVDAKSARKIFKAVSKIASKGLAHSAYAPGLGGLAAGFAKIAAAGRLGLDIDSSLIPTENGLIAEEILFSESNSRFIITASPKNHAKLAKILNGIPFACVGKVTSSREIRIRDKENIIAEFSIGEALAKYKSTLDGI